MISALVALGCTKGIWIVTMYYKIYTWVGFFVRCRYIMLYGALEPYKITTKAYKIGDCRKFGRITKVFQPTNMEGLFFASFFVFVFVFVLNLQSTLSKCYYVTSVTFSFPFGKYTSKCNMLLCYNKSTPLFVNLHCIIVICIKIHETNANFHLYYFSSLSLTMVHLALRV